MLSFTTSSYLSLLLLFSGIISYFVFSLFLHLAQTSPQRFFIILQIQAHTTFGTLETARAALDWCNRQHGIYHRETDGVPQDIHYENYAKQMRMLEMTPLLLFYLCPECWISFDDFVNYEGRRFGVPYSYRGSTARIMRKDDRIYIYSADMKQLPMPVRTEIVQLPEPETALSFEKFNFDKEVKWDD